ncbi:hypothetical protein San01_37980 [Streptomyces angustmyceticus]|uniref:Uncharacterized protein n=1 Tax=Streptomyces angustmyceticus TaxID=285578 RepID=A0A5J4LHD3_9ACTN|nr:hypothetical protein San01_37980 [Streptomyces angustmyceticus]
MRAGRPVGVTPGTWGAEGCWAGGGEEATAGLFSDLACFVWSYKTAGAADPGNPTKAPTVSNDTGTPRGPHGTGAGTGGSVGRKTACSS